MSEMDPERRQEIRHTMPRSGVDYLFFIHDRLIEVDSSSAFQIEHLAPRTISTEQLQVIADDLSNEGWVAEVVPVMEGKVIGFGIRVSNKDK